MDKEAQEKIENCLDGFASRLYLGEGIKARREYAIQILDIIKILGYRKLEGKPPLLNEAEMARTLPEIFDGSLSIDRYDEEKTKFLVIAQTQREADIKWYERIT